VQNAADEIGTPDLPRARPEAGRLVYMGSFMSYKGVDTLVRAVGMLPDHELHLMSRVPEHERQRLTRLAPEARLVFHDGATDAEYAAALAGATALVTASKAEGFGIPLVEAMRFGTPVVVTDIPIFREIGGDAATYFPADDAAAAARAIAALDAPGEWERRSAASADLAGRFTWSASAERLLALLLDVGEANGRAAHARR
jgi:glycosyltransferase involved in cell wall biosynthesis